MYKLVECGVLANQSNVQVYQIGISDSSVELWMHIGNISGLGWIELWQLFGSDPDATYYGTHYDALPSVGDKLDVGSELAVVSVGGAI